MIKTIFKETCIMLLLCVAIALILGVIFYDYIPANKAIPNKLAAYTTPDNVQTEIEENIIMDEEKENITYTITGADLNLYKQTHSYVTGKPDPFSASVTMENNTTNEAGSSGTGVNGNGNTTNKPTTDPNSTGTFFNNQGLK